MHSKHERNVTEYASKCNNRVKRRRRRHPLVMSRTAHAL